MAEVTCTVTEHDPGLMPTCFGTVPPLNESVVPTALTVPPQEVVVLAGLAKVIPVAAKSSVQAAGAVDSVRANEFGLNMLTVSVEVPPGAIDMGVKLLLICAGKDTPWACVTVAGLKTRELIRMQISDTNLNDLDNIISPPDQINGTKRFYNQWIGGTSYQTRTNSARLAGERPSRR